MPWENRGGGGGGPWGGGSNGGGGPWGRGGGAGGPRPPDLEDFIRKGQDRFKGILPPGGFGGGRGLLLAVAIIVAIWMLSGFYTVKTNEVGIVLRFGEFVDQTEPGLNWRYPWPIESVERPPVTDIHVIRVGFQTLGGDRLRGQTRDVPEESLMLTGDQNIIDIDFTVQWKIADAVNFLFKIRNPEQTVKIVAESAMRKIIGQTDIQLALSEARQDIELETRSLLQNILNDYEAGIEITEVKLQDVQPPGPVIDAFNDVIGARQDRQRLGNEAEAYRNDVLPRARGEAQRMIQEALGYRERLENEAQGEAQRFLAVYQAYLQNPEVTKRRMYLETMQNLLSGTDKVIMDRGVQGAVPYLPLNELRRASRGGERSGAASGATQ
ncbi:MAG: FtsH protease activity modulator HflK [Kiloniellaceae bacterium]